MQFIVSPLSLHFLYLFLHFFVSILISSFIFHLFSFIHNFYFLSFEGDFENVEEASETADAIAALKETIFNMLAGLN